ncbi:hypothetical protein HJC23_012703 [Cyclotella cryptica]|uniref:LAGLIDADG homing endonuclease n=1 Tax=Cyclotella cryptica TaxID=29204 RepID=A0ABD3PLV3_9STRA
MFNNELVTLVGVTYYIYYYAIHKTKHSHSDASFPYLHTMDSILIEIGRRERETFFLASSRQPLSHRYVSIIRIVWDIVWYRSSAIFLLIKGVRHSHHNLITWYHPIPAHHTIMAAYNTLGPLSSIIPLAQHSHSLSVAHATSQKSMKAGFVGANQDDNIILHYSNYSSRRYPHHRPPAMHFDSPPSLISHRINSSLEAITKRITTAKTRKGIPGRLRRIVQSTSLGPFGDDSVSGGARYDVTPNERAEILKAVISSNFSLNNVRVEVVSGYIWRYARTQKARLFYRGIRTWSEDGADELKLLIQNTYGPLLLGRIWPINTVFLEGDPRYRSVSSTLVRELCGKIKKSDGNDESEMEKSIEALKRLVPDRVVGRIVEVYGK